MFDHPAIIVGLEIGTSKVCAVVGEVTAEGMPNVIGFGQAKSAGVRKGEIADPAQVENCVRQAINSAEDMADVEIRSVYLGVTGSHIRGFNNRGMHPVVSADREITDEDVRDVVRNAKAVNLPSDGHVIHTVRQHFVLDGHGVSNPVGMCGALLGVDIHVVHGNLHRLQNAIRMVKGMELQVDEVVFNGLAASLAVLTPEQKELGSLVIDLGAGTTDYAVFAKGVLKHTGVLAVGGDHVSNDLAIGLKVTQGRAEQIKLKHGSAVLEGMETGRKLTLPGEPGLPPREINLEHLRRIMHLRLREIFELVGQDLEAAGLLDRLRGGVFLTGGGAGVPQIAHLAEEVFGLPVSPGRIHCISGLKSVLDQPEFATAHGLVKFGSLHQKRRSRSRLGGIREAITSLFR